MFALYKLHRDNRQDDISDEDIDQARLYDNWMSYIALGGGVALVVLGSLFLPVTVFNQLLFAGTAGWVWCLAWMLFTAWHDRLTSRERRANGKRFYQAHKAEIGATVAEFRNQRRAAA